MPTLELNRSFQLYLKVKLELVAFRVVLDGEGVEKMLSILQLQFDLTFVVEDVLVEVGVHGLGLVAD